MEEYLAHSPTAHSPRGQPLKEHLENVADQCAAFCSSFDAEADGRLCGLYHDVGKYSAAFQQRLKGSGAPVDHSTAGAKLLFDKHNVPAAMCIAGHHAGLSDLGTKNDLSDTFMARINQARGGGIEDFSAWEQELSESIPFGCKGRSGISYYFYTKMLFSALTDADWLDTEAYFEGRAHRPPSYDMEKLAGLLDAYVKRWAEPATDLDRRRTRIREAAVAHAADAPGLFSMTVPTGGGKTIASMAFALSHARCHGKRRIIYVIPYCSILEQTQQVFEEVFGREPVTAHYSGAEYSHGENSEDARAFSAENWEAPIILTTAVQFFESLYSDRPGKSRKLHNISQSVIVFDEAQMLPVPFLRPCLAATCRLVEDYGCSALLCTATQPAVGRLLEEFLPGHPLRELCPEPEAMYEAFRRVRYVDDGSLTDEELVESLRREQQVLCVVNSRRQAQDLYHALEPGEGNYHLSTMMTPADRRRNLQEIRQRLHDGAPCRVVSTSLIEAGVDVDFPAVYRALAGLDSILQAGGRCNREGKRLRDESLVHVFRTEAKAPRMLEQNISAAARILRSSLPLDSPEAVREYFQFLLYTLKDQDQLDQKRILKDAESLRFRSVAQNFRLIDGSGFTVYIPEGDGAALLQQLRRDGPSRSLLRKLQQYAVNVYPQYFRNLCDMGAAEAITENAGILLDSELYSQETGLPFEVSEQSKAIFI